MINKKDIVTHLTKPIPFEELAKHLGIKKQENRSLKKVLRAMLDAGELIQNRKGYYGLPEEMALVTGYFEAHREGFGFVISDRPGERDVFIPARSSMGAMDNDRVIARIESGQRRQGSIVRILERVHKKLAGVVDIVGDTCFVKPKDRAIAFEVLIGPAKEVNASKGDTVIVELTEYPAEMRPAVGRIIKTIAAPDNPRAEIEAIIAEYGLPGPFPAAVKLEARRLESEEIGVRRDIKALTTVTIDGERAKDFDDAISIDLSPHGYTLWVHIADVGHYVKWGDTIDMEARSRGTSVYFPDRVIPMLPKELSEELCSLKPKVERAAFTIRMEFDRSGVRGEAEFFPSLIVSNERMTYTSVRKILIDQDGQERKKYESLLREFELMGELAGLMRQRRLDRGSLDFDLPEPEVLLDIQGRPEAIIKSERNFAHMMIEEFMIAANEAVAEHLAEHELPAMYRIHEPPSAEKVEEALRLIKPSLAGRRSDPSMLHRALRDIGSSAYAEVASYIVLRTLKQAKYSTQNVGHFGLASKCYLHFTSPIRRYPDLVVHRILREALLKPMTPARIEELAGVLPDIAIECSRTERAAEKAERSVVGAMRMWFMEDKVGEVFTSTVVGVNPHGMWVRLDEFYVDGFLHVSGLTDDYYIYDERAMRLRGKRSGRQFMLGNPLTVRLERIDRTERELIFGLVSEKKTTKAPNSKTIADEKKEKKKRPFRRGATGRSSGRRASRG